MSALFARHPRLIKFSFLEIDPIDENGNPQVFIFRKFPTEKYQFRATENSKTENLTVFRKSVSKDRSKKSEKTGVIFSLSSDLREIKKLRKTKKKFSILPIRPLLTYTGKFLEQEQDFGFSIPARPRQDFWAIFPAPAEQEKKWSRISSEFLD